MKRIFFGPSDWMASRTSARERRAFGFWLGVLFVVLTVASWASVDHAVAGHALSALTLLLLCWTIVTTETPVEEEE